MAKPTPAARGYGPDHRRMRAAVAPHVRSGRAVCTRCGKPIRLVRDALGRLVPEPWDLGHSDDRRTWTGPEHASCNRSAGARKGNAQRARREHVDPPPPPGW